MSCTCIQGEMPAPLVHFMCFTNHKPIQVKALIVYERERETKGPTTSSRFSFSQCMLVKSSFTAFVDICPTPIYPPNIVPSQCWSTVQVDMYLGAYLGVQNWKQLLSFYENFGTYSSSLFASTNTTIALVHTQNFHLLKEQEFIYRSTFQKCRILENIDYICQKNNNLKGKRKLVR